MISRAHVEEAPAVFEERRSSLTMCAAMEYEPVERKSRRVKNKKMAKRAISESESEGEDSDCRSAGSFKAATSSIVKTIKGKKSTTQDKNNYKSIAELFNNEGKMTNDIFIETFLRSTPDKPAEIALMTDEIWWTILALAILQAKFMKKEAEWKMIAKKATAFLKKNKVSDDVVSKIKLSLK